MPAISDNCISEIAFGPLTLAAVRLPGAEALSGEILFQLLAAGGYF
jgi:hypothetical protein